MKKLLIFALMLALMPVCPIKSADTAYAAYTLDNINSSYDTADKPVKKPYLLPGRGFFPMDPVEIILSANTINFHYNADEAPVSLNGQTMPLNAVRGTVAYSSSDPSVASVTEDGIVTSGNKLGSAVITASSGSLTAECIVNVIVGVTGVSVTPKETSLYADKPVAIQLEAEISPADADIKDVTWETSDASVATVDRNGTVMPCGVGDVTITAVTKDGGFFDSSSIKVDVWDDTEQSVDSVNYSHYSHTIRSAVEIQMTASPVVFDTDSFPATEIEIENYLTPSFLLNSSEMYQFLDLSKSSGVDSDTLDAYLNGKGTLDNTGDVFWKAAQIYGINEVYLVIHACLETGNGTSDLASGVEYNGQTVYNMFGIGAVDSSPVSGGAEYAYNNGWFTPEAAIEGGAEWISENYINNEKYEQNTLYKMRWNPDSPGVHQYATDVAWASKQAAMLKKMFDAFPSAALSFDYPVYSGESEEEITLD